MFATASYSIIELMHLPEKVSLQLKLLPQENYQNTISKARELLLIYGRSTGTEQVNQVQVNPSNEQLEKLEETLTLVTQQLAALSKPLPGHHSV